MNPIRLLLFSMLFTVTDLSSQSKQSLEKQKIEIQNEIKVIEKKLSNSTKKKGLINQQTKNLIMLNVVSESQGILLKLKMV